MTRQQRNSGSPTARSRSLDRPSASSQRHGLQNSNGSSPLRPASPSREAIAEAAYFLWLQRGGDDVNNWLEAEAKLRGRDGARRW